MISVAKWLLWSVIVFSVASCQKAEEDSPYSFEIDGRNVIVNGHQLTPGGSSDELVNLLGVPDYAWSPGQTNVVFWKQLGLGASVLNGCVERLAVQISPVLEEDIPAWVREEFPGRRPLPRFPGRIILDGVELSPELPFDELNARKRAPLFKPISKLLTRGVAPSREIEVLGDSPYTVILNINRYTEHLERIVFYPRGKGECQSKPLVNKEMLEGKA